MKKSPRRINNLPPSNAVQALLCAGGAVINTARRDESTLDAVWIYGPVIVREYVLKEPHATDVEPADGTRGRNPLAYRPYAPTQAGYLTLERHYARI